MSERTPTILATSGGFRFGRRTVLAPGPLVDFAISLAGKPRYPRFCHIGTAGGDQRYLQAWINDAFTDSDVHVTHLNLFPLPNVADIRAHLLEQDVVWVGTGSVAGLLAMWRLHGLDEILREVWEAGVVLSGASAGSLCWHVGGTTDSFGPTLRPVTDGLGLLPFANSVHHSSEEQRRPLFARLIADSTLPEGYATDDGVGLLYRGTEFVEAVSDTPGAAAYHVRREGDEAVETRIEPRLLP